MYQYSTLIIDCFEEYLFHPNLHTLLLLLNTRRLVSANPEDKW